MSLAAPIVRPGAVLADLLPAAGTTRGRALVRDAALVLGGAAFTGLAAQLSVPVPGSPVPVTGQTLAALLVGTALGARRGVASLALYLVAGIAGVPWLAGGASGMSASIGYAVGFVVAGALVGELARRGADRSPLRTAAAMVLGNLAIYAVGVPWLAVALHVSLAQAASLGLYPFLIGDAIKIAFAMGLLPAAWKLVGRRVS
ncbi:biotin transporter BioY [Streptacidiphilus jiangxiensis]|uniref:Biotin transporter n=1 Tax=Streptacidiphilus jiangxiensis TaxID=235985 RepID=A0A1H7S3J1_STRJI|nr:biotin transporter BioY [Streptacidiphilus jiangxiensis]SEL67211.1 biotin transport system substrate-specific component [Streptacidiphilus jiangxiensis]